MHEIVAVTPDKPVFGGTHPCEQPALNLAAAIYIAGPAVHAQAICRLIGDLPGITAALLLSPNAPAARESVLVPTLAASAAALLLISFGSTEILQACLAAAADLPFTITPGHIALMTNGGDNGEISVAIDQGINVYISSDETLTSLQKGLTAALDGFPFCSLLLQPLVNAARRLPRSPPHTVPQKQRIAPVLSAREWEVAAIIIQGRSDAEAAACLFISVSTLKTHLRALYHKLGIERRGQLHAALTPFRPPSS